MLRNKKSDIHEISKNYKLTINIVYFLLPCIGNSYPAAPPPAYGAISNPDNTGYNPYPTYPSNSTAPRQEFNTPPYAGPSNSTIPYPPGSAYPPGSTDNTPYPPGPASNTPYPPGPTGYTPYPPGSTSTTPYPPGPTSNAP